LFNNSPYLLGHGIGPLSSEWSRLFARIIFYNSKTIFVRDNDSYNLVSSLGFNKKCVEGFDCATLFFENRNHSNLFKKKDSNEKRIIGISMLPAYTIYSGDNDKDEEIIKSLAINLENLFHLNDSTEFRLFAFRTGLKHSDVHILGSLKRLNKNASCDIRIIKYTGDIENFLDLMDECDIFIGARYHASLFAYLLHKPQLIIDYMGKCASLGKDIAIEQTAIIHLDSVLTSEFGDILHKLISNSDRYIAGLPVQSAIQRTHRMFDSMGEEL
jgi:polysaccharide pyruvyl transferase WcaK-like protein